MVPDLALEKNAFGRRPRCCAETKTDARDFEGGDPNLTSTWSAPPRSASWGLDRPAGHAGALAGRHRGQFFPRARPSTGTLVMAAGDINLDLQALSDVADPDDAEGRLRHRTRRRGRRCRDECAPIWRPGVTGEAYAVVACRVGHESGARYEALTMYDQRDTNGTELRASPAISLFSTGAKRIRRALHVRAFRSCR